MFLFSIFTRNNNNTSHKLDGSVSTRKIVFCWLRINILLEKSVMEEYRIMWQMQAVDGK